jgi:uncharacterized repeat protein (TIGR02543 family)
MKTILTVLMLLMISQLALAQNPTYELVLKNDSLVSSTIYEFDIVLQRTGGTAFELASIQPIMTFNTGISSGSLTLSMNAGTSDLNSSQQPTTMTINGNELRITPRVPPGAGSGTVISTSPGSRVGRFRLTSTTAFEYQTADIAWKNGLNPFTRVFAYVGGVNTEITDSLTHLNQLANANLSVPFITTSSPLPGATSGTPYSQTLTVSGGTPEYFFQVTSGTIAPGLSLSFDGNITGTPTTAGTFVFTVSVSDGNNQSSDKEFSLTTNPGPPFKLVYVQQPTTTAVSAIITPAVTVQVQDAGSNNLAVAGISTTIAISSGTGTLSGTLTQLTNASGIATFNNLSINQIGSKILTTASTGLLSTVSGLFTITPGPASQVVFIQEPTNTTAGGTISPSITVQLRDALGNNVSSSGVAITLALTTGTGTLSGTTTRTTNGSGLAVFDDISINLAGSKNLTASSTSLTSDISNAFTIAVGSASVLAIVQQPTNTTAGVNISPSITVHVQDGFGNDVSGAGVSIDMTISSGTGILGGSTSRNTTGAGVATFNNLNITTAGVKVLTASSTGLTSAVSNSFTILPASASQVVLIQQPTNTTAGATITPAVTAQIRDTFGNDVTTAGTPVTMSLSSGTGTLSGTTSQLTNSSGLATFSDLIINLSGTKSLTAASTGLTSAISSAFTISAGSATQVVFIQQPTNATAGATISPSITIQLRDGLGNNVSSAGVSVTLALSSGTGTLNGTLTQLTNASGLATFNNLSITVAGSKALTASSSGLTSAISNSFTISPATATTLVFVQQPTSTTAATVITPAITTELRDNFGNTVPNAGVSITMALSSGTGTLSGTTVRTTDASGVATFNDLSINLVGSKALTASGSGLTPAVSNAFTISAGGATQLTFVQQPTTTTAGAIINPNITVQLRDGAGNDVASAGVSVTLALTTGTGVLSGTLTQLTNASGLATFNDLSINLSGSKNITASSGGLTSAISSSFTINPALATQLVFIQQPTGAVANSPITPAVTVQLRDNFGNNVANPGVSVLMTLSSGSGALSGTTTQLTNGSGLATFSDLSINLTGTKAITASSSGLTSAVSTSFTITIGAATQILVETAADGSGTIVPSQNVVSGNSITVFAISRDASNNFIANVAAASWLLQNSTGGIVGGDLVPSGDSRSATFTGHGTGTAQIRATSGVLTPTNSGTLTVIPGIQSKVVFVQQPSNGIAGAVIAPPVTVQLQDASNNNVASAGINVTLALASGTGTLSGTTTQATNGSGLATFNDLSINQTGAKTLSASSGGLTGAVSSSFTLSSYTITASAGANGSISPSGAVSVNHGSDQAFTITPNTGYSVSNVLVDGISVGAVTGYTFSNVTANHTIAASFSPNTLSITVSTIPSGRTITVDGINYTSPQTFSWTANTTHSIATDSLQNLNASTRYAWTSWNDAGARAHSVTPLVNSTYTATFKTQYLLTMNANTGGTVTPSTGFQDADSFVVINAIPNTGYSFSSWTGSGPGSASGGGTPRTIFMGGPITQTANFSLDDVLITVNTNPAGRTFRVDGVLYSLPQTFSFQPGSVHTLSTDSIQSEVSNARLLWSNWSDGQGLAHAFVVPSTNTTYTANFKRQFFLAMNAGTGGTVSPPSNWNDSAAVVPISATPSGGYSFSGWTGTGAGSYSGPANPSNVTMSGPITESASFTLFPVNITVNTNPPGRTFTVDGVQYTNSQSFVWSATQTHELSTTSPQGDTATRYLWSSWSDGGAQTHNVAPITNTTYTVNFSTQHYLSMNAGTGGTVSPPSNWFNSGQVVAISATPGTGYSFGNWSGSGTGSYTGTNNPSSVTMNSPITETGNFTPNTIQVTVQTSPAGRSIIVDGTTYTAPQVFNWQANSNHTISTDSIQNGAAGTRYIWSGWNDAGARTHTVSSLVNTTFTATFSTQYLLTMNAGTGGTVSPPSNWFNSGQVVPISATANTGYTFSSWSGTGTGSYTGPVNSSSVTMNASITETANFTANNISVTVQTVPGGRTIIVDGVTYTAPQVFNWVANSNHTVSTDTIQNGTAGTRYVWASWSDSGARSHTVAPLVNTTYTVNFTTQYFLTMNANVGGTVLPPSGWYNSGDNVIITAIANSGYGFINWSGVGSGSYSGGNNPGNVLMFGPITETANFAQNPYQVTIGTSPAGRAYRVNGTDYTTPQTFSVAPGNGLFLSIVTDPQPGTAGTQYAWSNWSDGGAINHFFVPASDSIVVASFTTQYLLTMNAGTGGTVNPTTNWHNSGTSVPITATPNIGYSFSSWTGSGSGSYTGPNNPSSVTMNGPITENASFTLFPVQVTVQSSPPGRTIIVDGTTYTSPQTFVFTSGTNHTIASDSIQSGSAGTRYLWTGWSDAGTRSHSVTVVKDTTFTVSFKTQFLLTTSAGTGGTVTPPTGYYDSAQVVPVTAIPNGGYTFTGWTGTGTGSYTGPVNPANVTMHSPITQTAGFSLGSVQITVQTVPGGRTIIVDGVTYTAPQVFNWVANSNHTVSTDTIQNGTAGTRYVWASWSDSGARSHSITPSSDSTFVVNFTTQHYLTMIANTGGTASPPSGWVNAGTFVTITATQNTGYTFVSWSGSGSGSYSGGNNPGVLLMNGPITETANFTQNTVLVTIRTNPSGRTFVVNGNVYVSVFTFSFLPGSLHNISADSIQNLAGGVRYVFKSWSDSGALSHSIIIPSHDTTITANFGIQYALTTVPNPPTGGVTTPSGQTYYNTGDTATFSATENPGYLFMGWSGSFSGTQNPAKILMNSAKTVTANFSPSALITIATHPAGRTIIIDDSTYAAPKTFNWLLNTNHTIGTLTPQQLATPTQYLWNRWSDSGAISHTITVVKDTLIVADFTTQHYLYTVAGSGGSVIPVDGGWYDEHDTVEISATPDSGFGFIEWQGTGTGSYSGGNSDATIIMNGWIVESATFGLLLSPPSLAGIANGATDVPLAPVLRWNSYPGATAYIVQVATDSLFNNTVFDSSTITDTSVQVNALRNLTTYYWRVKAKVGANITSFSASRYFITRPKSISVITPARPWVSRFVTSLTWSSIDLTGLVNIRLSTNGGITFTTLLTDVPNTGTLTWRLPDATPVGTNCRVRVESATDGTIFGTSGPFSVVSGQLPLIVPMSTSFIFPSEPYRSTYYRLVSSPGIVDTTQRLQEIIPGTQGTDWRMFRDNGLPLDYLVELLPTSTIATGEGYWLLKKNNLDYAVNMTMPPLDTLDATFSIPLHTGWNIIANPFDKNIAWSSVVQVNSLAPATQAYGYDGSFSSVTTLEPFKGYYYFNEANASFLRIPYPFSSPSQSPVQMPPADWKVQLALESDINSDPENYIGVSKQASAGYDETESHKPPLFLDQGFLYFERPAWDKNYSLFNTDFRPAIGEGQTWNFEVSKKPGTKGSITFRGIETIPAEYKVVLINAYNNAPYNLRENSTYSFTTVVQKMQFKMIVGTKEFVEKELSNDVPAEFELAQNFPNPFNATTSISFKLPKESKVRLDIYSILGQRVTTLADGVYPQGTHTFVWEGADQNGLPVASGVYLYRLLDGENLIQTKKMILTK